MSRHHGPVDLAAVRAAKERLAAHLREHPEIRERTAALFANNPTVNELEEIMVKENDVAVKLPADLVARVDALVEELKRDPRRAAFGVSRTAVIRLGLFEWLEQAEQGSDRLPDATPAPVTVTASPRRRARPKSKPKTSKASTSKKTVTASPRKRAPKAPLPETGAPAKLRRWRLSQGIKRQAEAAAMVGVGQTTWSRWESGVQPPAVEDAAKLEKLTGIPADSWTS